MAIPTLGARPRARPKVTPTLRTSASGKVDNGSTEVSVTIPTSAQVGDFAVFVICEAAGTCSTPAGLTKEGQSTVGNSTNIPYLHVYSRRLVAGDVSSDYGLTFTFTAGSSDGLCGTVQSTPPSPASPTAPCSARPPPEVEEQQQPVRSVRVGSRRTRSVT